MALSDEGQSVHHGLRSGWHGLRHWRQLRSFDSGRSPQLGGPASEASSVVVGSDGAIYHCTAGLYSNGELAVRTQTVPCATRLR